MGLNKPERTNCMKETGVDEKEAKAAFGAQKFPAKRNFKCYLECQHRHLGFIDADDNARECKEQVSHIADVCEKLYEYVVKCGIPKVFAKLN
ncbi:hypothetical protein FQA39_LY10680 [Lamprigera yunnana]|nr:hypothetical protein FQA39_LY10680 [Lamprigera yunnana]